MASIPCYNHSQGCLTLPLHYLPAPSAGCTQRGAAAAADASSSAASDGSGSGKGSSTIAIAEIPAHNRSLPALSQPEVLAALQLLMAAPTGYPAAAVLVDPAIAGGSSAAATPLLAAQLMLAEDLVVAIGERVPERCPSHLACPAIRSGFALPYTRPNASAAGASLTPAGIGAPARRWPAAGGAGGAARRVDPAAR